MDGTSHHKLLGDIIRRQLSHSAGSDCFAAFGAGDGSEAEREASEIVSSAVGWLAILGDGG